MLKIGLTTLKSIEGVSNVLRCLASSFEVVGKWVAWKVGQGDRLRIGEDPWIACIENYKLFEALKQTLHKLGCTRLRDVSIHDYGGKWVQRWKSMEYLYL